MPFGQREWSRIFYPFYPRSNIFSERECFDKLSTSATDALRAMRMIAD
jgi:hypothetical protein